MQTPLYRALNIERFYAIGVSADDKCSVMNNAKIVARYAFLIAFCSSFIVLNVPFIFLILYILD